MYVIDTDIFFSTYIAVVITMINYYTNYREAKINFFILVEHD